MAILKGPVNPVVTGITTFPELDNIQVATPNRHSVKPSLVLDFANSKTLDPRVTFTRGSNATFYDGTTALAEQNLLLYSQKYDESYWGKRNSSVTANSITAPDGTLTAYTLTDNSASNVHSIQVEPNNPAGTYTQSIYAKAGTSNFIGFKSTSSPASANQYFNVAFNLSTGAANTPTVVGSNFTNVTSSITSVGSGWYRCSVTYTTATAQAEVFYMMMPSYPPTVADYGDIFYIGSGSTIYIWGAQLEQRPFASAYNLTTTTRILNYIPVLKTAGPNQPRFDVDPITQESKGLLIEEQRTNLFNYSSNFENAYWSLDAGGTLVTNGGVSPDGTLSAEFIRESTSGGITPRLIKTAFNADLSGTNFTYSMYVKSVGTKRNIFMLCQDGVNGFYAHFDVVAGTVVQATTSGTGTLVGSGIEHKGNGWYRIWITGRITSTSIYSMIHLEAVTGTGFGAAAYTGDGFSGMLVWGAQMETGPFPTSYIPTLAASATRSMDAAVINGSNFSSWFNNREGTVYGQVSAGQGFFPNIFTVNDGTNNNAFYISRVSSAATPSTTLRYQWTNEAGVINDMGPGNNVFAAAYKQADYQMGNNGLVGTVDTTVGAIPVLSAMNIGNFPSGAFPWNGYIKKLAYYPVRLTSAELQGLTAS